MDNQPIPSPDEKLLPRPPRPVLFFLILTVLDITGAYSAVVAGVLGNLGIAILLGLGLVAITFVAIINHRHNHDHRWLLTTAAVITIVLAILWSVALVNR